MGNCKMTHEIHRKHSDNWANEANNITAVITLAIGRNGYMVQSYWLKVFSQTVRGQTNE